MAQPNNRGNQGGNQNQGSGQQTANITVAELLRIPGVVNAWNTHCAALPAATPRPKVTVDELLSIPTVLAAYAAHHAPRVTPQPAPANPAPAAPAPAPTPPAPTDQTPALARKSSWGKKLIKCFIIALFFCIAAFGLMHVVERGLPVAVVARDNPQRQILAFPDLRGELEATKKALETERLAHKTDVETIAAANSRTLATKESELAEARRNLVQALADSNSAMVSGMRAERDRAVSDRAAAISSLTAVTRERDTARADHAATVTSLTLAISERDTARGERDAARTELAQARTGHAAEVARITSANATEIGTWRSAMEAARGRLDDARRAVQLMTVSSTGMKLNVPTDCDVLLANVPPNTGLRIDMVREGCGRVSGADVVAAANQFVPVYTFRGLPSDLYTAQIRRSDAPAGQEPWLRRTRVFADQNTWVSYVRLPGETFWREIRNPRPFVLFGFGAVEIREVMPQSGELLLSNGETVQVENGQVVRGDGRRVASRK